uniref:Uncharacterized protein n=1 Tax=Anguilla anguilla TaxID=7936 RepID=A0A0E9X1V5_ANGAN
MRNMFTEIHIAHFCFSCKKKQKYTVLCAVCDQTAHRRGSSAFQKLFRCHKDMKSPFVKGDTWYIIFNYEQSMTYESDGNSWAFSTM